LWKEITFNLGVQECKDKVEMCGIVFEALDDDRSGYLDLKEMIKQLDPYHKKATFVLTGDGQVEYSMKYWEDIFKGYDKDKNGHVSKKEFSSAIVEKFKDKSDELFVLILAKMLKSAAMINAAKGEPAEEKKKD